MKTRIGVLCGCAILCLGALLLARPGTVKTRDGQVIEGDIKEESRSVTVTRRNIPFVIQRADIESIEYAGGTVEEQYEQKMAALDAKDVAGRIAVARWAFDQDQYLLARQALESALTIEPNNREANTLLENVRLQMRLERAKGKAEERRATTATAPANEDATAAQGVHDPRNLLSLDDINVIRQFELKPTDTHVRINFAKDVKKRFAGAQNIRVQDFNALTPFDQLQRIMREGTEDMRRDVRIVSDPSSILEYRRSIQPLVLTSCATSGCHGAAGAGGLMLFAPADNEAVTYTNFFILNDYAKRAGEGQGPFDAGERRMIDRVEPSQSLLLQYGLPPAIAQEDHPTVNGFRAIFRNRDDPGYRRVADWIASSLRGIKPDYGLAYTPPQRAGSRVVVAPVTSQPATAATRPAAPKTAATQRSR